VKRPLAAALLTGLLAACQPPSAPAAQPNVNIQTETARTLVAGLRDFSQADAVAAQVGGTVLARLPNLNAVLIGLSGPRPDARAAALSLMAHGDVVYAAPQSSWTATDPLEAARTPGLLPQSLTQVIDTLPQYALDANHLNARAAWNAGLRGAGVTIGVVDGPVDLSNPDLASRWAGKAFDPLSGNEYKTAEEWSAATRTAAGGTLKAGDSGHATAVASAAVAAQNGVGIVGAAPDAQFVTAAVFQPGARGETFVGSFAAARAIVWATDAGARVLNLSWGSFGYDPLLKSATDYALRRGVTVVAAAGNSGGSARQQPAMYPGVLASAAGDLAGGRAAFSSFSPGSSLTTPGVDLLLGTPGWGAANGFALYSGTSFSAPLLSGAAALLLGKSPSLDPYQVRTLLTSAAGETGALNLGRLPALLSAPAPLAAATAHLSLKVRTASGDVPAVLGDVTLLSTDPAGPVYLAQTDAQGRADFVAVQPGSYRVLAAAPDLSITGGQATDRGSLGTDLTLPPGVLTEQTYTLDRGAVNLHPVDPYEPNDDITSASPVAYSQQTELAYISGKARDVDFFAFQGRAGDSVRASITARGDAAVGGQLDSVLVLRDPAGQITSYDDDYVNSDSRLEATLPATGRYTLEVSSFRILGPSVGADAALGQPDDSPFNRYRLRLDQLNAP
jgi:subtilisin family serine protease